MGDLKKRFGSLVAANRRRLGWTQEQLAQAANLSVDMVSKIESGASGARFPVVERLAEALGVDSADLFATKLQGGHVLRGTSAEIASTLSGLSEKDLRWVQRLLEVALKRS